MAKKQSTKRKAGRPKGSKNAGSHGLSEQLKSMTAEHLASLITDAKSLLHHARESIVRSKDEALAAIDRALGEASAATSKGRRGRKPAARPTSGKGSREPRGTGKEAKLIAAFQGKPASATMTIPEVHAIVGGKKTSLSVLLSKMRKEKTLDSAGRGLVKRGSKFPN